MSTRKSHFDAKLLDRIKQTLNLQTDSELADYLGVSPTVIANWRRRDRVNTSHIMSKCEYLDVHWILYGTTQRHNKSAYKQSDEVIASNRAEKSFVSENFEQLETEKQKLELENTRLQSKIEVLEDLIIRLKKENYK